jgi:hypothetical protein
MFRFFQLILLCSSLVLMSELPAMAVDINAKKFNDRVSNGRRSFTQRGNRNRGRAYNPASRQRVNNYVNDVLSRVKTSGLNSSNNNSGYESELSGFLRDWVSAWEGTATYSSVSSYRTFYHPNFYASYKGMGLSGWMNDKLAKGKMKNWIDIEILDGRYGYEILNNGSAVIVFDQIYKSDTYVDRGIKYLYLTRYNGSWKVLREEQPDYVELCSDNCSSFTTYR